MGWRIMPLVPGELEMRDPRRFHLRQQGCCFKGFPAAGSPQGVRPARRLGSFPLPDQQERNQQHQSTGL
jgi:hypothetical protein